MYHDKNMLTYGDKTHHQAKTNITNKNYKLNRS